MKRRAQAALLAAVSGLLAACAGPSTSLKKALERDLEARNFDAAISRIEAAKERQYGRRNSVLYHLDLGMVLHNAGRYKDSDRELDKAESRMEALYTKSAHKMAEMLVINDAMMDYAGEPFERAMTNILRALNYVFLGQPDEALVEARKVEVFLDELYRKQERKPAYKDDAFARYLDSLLYADAGQGDDARISLEAAMRSYAWYASAYRTPAPQFSLDDAPNLGEVVLIHYNGLGPRKISKTFQVAWNQALAAVRSSSGDTEAQASRQQVDNALRAGIAGNAITLSFPAYVQDPFNIAGSELQVGEASGSSQLVEDLAAIAEKDLADRLGLIKTRSIARATIKFILSQAAQKEAEKKGGKVAGLLAGFAASAAAAATEIADTRAWDTMPAQIRLARLRVRPGRYPVTVRFKSASGAVVSTYTFPDVVVKRGKRTYLQYRTAS